MTQKFDPITLEILWSRLISIAEEADASIARTAFSTVVRDAHDYSTIITDAYGQEICQGPRVTPGQCGGLVLGVKKIVNMFPLIRLHGEILLNDFRHIDVVTIMPDVPRIILSDEIDDELQRILRCESSWCFHNISPCLATYVRC